MMFLLFILVNNHRKAKVQQLTVKFDFGPILKIGFDAKM